jgi:hypothetical protein
MVLWRPSNFVFAIARPYMMKQRKRGGSKAAPILSPHSTNHHPEREGTINLPPHDQSHGERERGFAIP